MIGLPGNIAYGRRAAMPSATDTSKLTGPEKGVDGELHMDSCVEAATGRRTEPAWYRVDLGALHVVVSVTAFNGLGTCRGCYRAIVCSNVTIPCPCARKRAMRFAESGPGRIWAHHTGIPLNW